MGTNSGARKVNPRNIPAWPCEAGDEPVPNRIGYDPRDNGDCAGRLLGCQGCSRVPSNNDVNLETGQLGHELREPLDPSLRRSVLDDDGPALHVAALAQPLPECVEQCAGQGKLRGGGQ